MVRFLQHSVLASLVAVTMARSASLGSVKVEDASSKTSSTAPSKTSSGAAQTHTIYVGYGGEHKFRPLVTEAEVGDVIEFDFYPLNHSVARSEFGYPCIPYEDTGPGKKGFFSEFQPIEAILNNPPTFSVLINDTDPIYFYCTAPGSCIDHGMVGGINANRSDVLLQQQKAEKSTIMLQPGEPFPGESSSSINLSSMSATSTPTATPEVLHHHHPSTSDNDGDSGLGGGAIAGIVVGVLGFLAIVGALFFFIGRSRTLKQSLDQNATNAPPNNQQQPPDMYQSGGGMFSPTHSEFRDSHMSSPYQPPPQYPKGAGFYEGDVRYSNMGSHTYSEGFPSPGMQYSELGSPPRVASPPPAPSGPLPDLPKEKIQAPVELPAADRSEQ